MERRPSFAERFDSKISVVTPTGKLSSRNGSASHTDWAASSRRRPRRATPTGGSGPDAESGFGAALRSPSSALAYAGMQVGAGFAANGGASGRTSGSRDGSDLLRGLDGLAADLAGHAPHRGHAGQPPPGAWQPPSPTPHPGPGPRGRHGSDSLDSALDLGAPWEEAPRTPPYPRVGSPVNSLGGLSGGSAAHPAALATAAGQWHPHAGHQQGSPLNSYERSPDRDRGRRDRHGGGGGGGGGDAQWEPGFDGRGMLHGSHDRGRAGPNSWAPPGAAPPSVYSDGSEAFPRFGRADVPSLDMHGGPGRGPDAFQAASPSMRAAGAPANGGAAVASGGRDGSRDAGRRQRRRRHAPSPARDASSDASDDDSSAEINHRQSRNEALIRSERDRLYFSTKARPSKQQFKPYTLNDCRRHMPWMRNGQYYEVPRGLPLNPDTDEIKAARESRERALSYGKNVREKHATSLRPGGSAPPQRTSKKSSPHAALLASMFSLDAPFPPQSPTRAKAGAGAGSQGAEGGTRSRTKLAEVDLDKDHRLRPIKQLHDRARREVMLMRRQFQLPDQP